MRCLVVSEGARGCGGAAAEAWETLGPNHEQTKHEEAKSRGAGRPGGKRRGPPVPEQVPTAGLCAICSRLARARWLSQ